MGKPETDDLKKEVEMDEHQIPIADLEARLGTNVQTGLTAAAAKQLLEQNGYNELTPPKTTPEWIKFCRNLFGGFSTLLWVGSILCFFAYGMEIARGAENPQKDNLYLGVVLATVVIVTGWYCIRTLHVHERCMDHDW
jgi:sodium/potassium-transporting ATPase subunit alpha